MLKTFFHTYFLTILTQKMNASFTMYGDKLLYMFRIVFPTIYVQQLLYYNIHTKKYVRLCYLWHFTHHRSSKRILSCFCIHLYHFNTYICLFLFPLCTRTTSNIFNKSPPHLFFTSLLPLLFFFTIYTKLKSSGKTIKSGVLKIQTNSSRDTIIVDPGASMN